MKLSEILRAGKQRIETQGWCQGHAKACDPERRFGYCIGTALMGAAATGASIDEALASFLLYDATGNADSFTAWNDAPERTLAEVLAAYDKAITAAEAQEQAK